MLQLDEVKFVYFFLLLNIYMYILGFESRSLLMENALPLRYVPSPHLTFVGDEVLLNGPD